MIESQQIVHIPLSSAIPCHIYVEPRPFSTPNIVKISISSTREEHGIVIAVEREVQNPENRNRQAKNCTWSFCLM
jgi:hypothetical protein